MNENNMETKEETEYRIKQNAKIKRITHCPICNEEAFIESWTPCSDEPDITTWFMECTVCDWTSEHTPWDLNKY